MSNLRSDWMKIRDLEYAEKTLIKSVERFIPDAVNFLGELQLQAVGAAAAQAAKEEAKKQGTSGLGRVTKKSPTIPVSPRINKPRPPTLPEPEKIEQAFYGTDVPSYLDYTNLETIIKQKQDNLEATREMVKSKYGEKHEFKFQELKAGRDIEEVRREIEETKEKELAFNSTFVHPPPNFSKIKAKIRLNASASYREDALFRKQQAKDAKLLKQYEEELRDQTEFLIWQKEMKRK